MDRDQDGSSRPKRACIGKSPYELEIQLKLHSKDDDNL